MAQRIRACVAFVSKVERRVRCSGAAGVSAVSARAAYAVRKMHKPVGVAATLAFIGSVAMTEEQAARAEGGTGGAGGSSGVSPSSMPVTVTASIKGSVTPAVEERPSGCREGMVEVEGDYCPALEQKCLKWLDGELKLRCGEFAPTGKCQTATIKKRFCMDKYEYPNKVGEKPVVMKTWHEAVQSCKSEGKRLCRDSEWTLACEGQERLPYPYGYERNAEACNIDKPHPAVDERALSNPATRDAEAARLDQRAPSGSYEACVSPYGVHDMAGNVDEWVINESHTPYQSGSKGGYWGPVRTRCRPMTVAHYEMFSFYQLGFRCCSDAQPKPPEPAAPPPEAENKTAAR
ncbi:MAG: SUMF1/EgtB/PvdO family nonheme iron enzyme [Polyangiaceae bacterium]